MAAYLHRGPLVRFVRRAIVALALSACGPGEVEPRTPVNAQFIDPTCVDAPAIEDGFPEALARSEAQASTRRSERPPSISLGEIGDSPLGTEPTPPHRVPDWEQPFPCDWTNTCYVPRVNSPVVVGYRAVLVAP